MTNGTDADIAVLRTEVAQLRTDLAKISDALRDLVRHGGAEAMEKLEQSGENVREEIKRKAQSVAHEIEERPIASALAAFGVGMILGMLFHGRRS